MELNKTFVIILLLATNILWLLYTFNVFSRIFFRKKYEWFKRLSFRTKLLFTSICWIILAIVIYSLLVTLFGNDNINLGYYFSIASFIIALIQISKSSQKEIYGLMHIRSKERIKILSEFSPKRDLIGNKSIYNTIIDVLRRCSKANLRNSQLKILVCSPLIDYRERIRSVNDWGKEFTGIIKEIMNKEEKNTHIDIFHLPDTALNGVNPLKSFTEVLSNFISTEDTEPSTKNFETIWKETKSFIDDMNKMDIDNNSPFSVNRTIVTDIPFQIIIYKSTDINEVIVSFAGKKILEDESLTEPYGFHSVDVDVVEAFENIFNSYVQEKRRNPIKPVHTLELIERSKEKGKHVINDYLKAKKYDNVIERFDINPISISIEENTYSPAFANSSKFTSLVIKNILGKEDTVMEIGAGSGIQSIVAYNTLLKLGNSTPTVYAVECEDAAFELLKNNLSQNNLTKDETTKTGITTLKAELYSEVTKYDYKQESKGHKKTEINKGWNSPAKSKLEEYCTIKKDYLLEITNGALYEKDTDNNPKEVSVSDTISFLIADLPYVDTSTKENGLERAFFDPNHNAHKTLFNFFAKSSIFKNEARLITSFSTLGGEEDLIRFELMINECNLHILHKQCFVEANYEWIVYTLYKNNSFDWWDYLNVKADAISPTT